MIDPQAIKALLSSVDLVALVGQDAHVKRAGKEYVALCPFHEDHSPSFTIFEKDGVQLCKCFACGWPKDIGAADAIRYVMDRRGIGFKDAYDFLGGKTQIAAGFAAGAAPAREPPPIADEWISSKPPKDARTPDFHLGKFGDPSRVWEYRDAAGEPLGYIARYDLGSNGSRRKEFRPWTWGRMSTDDEGDERWEMRTWATPRPLYGLDRLAERPAAQVVVHEGEKAADAGTELLPNQVSVAWPGGANGLRHKVDLEPLRGRNVVLLEDADEPGRACMSWLAERLPAMGCVVKRCDTSDMPEGWDIADGLAEGWTPDQALEWVKSHVALVAPTEAKPAAQPAAIIDDASNTHIGPRTEPVSGIIYRRVSDVQARNVNWLWPGRIAKGKFSVIVGNPGLGKSQVTASLASIVTVGGLWPVDRTRAEQGSVVIMSAEDDAEDTIRPRLEAAGADLERIYLLQAVKVESDRGEGEVRGFNLQADTAKLGALLQEIGDVALVIIDPISAYLGNADSHNNAEVRSLLAPLVDMAGAHGAAILAVSHLTKSQGMDALLRLQGSVAFAAAARAVWGVAKDKENPQRRLFMPLKNNLGTDVSGFAYSVESFRLEGTDPPIETSHVMWEAEQVTITAEEAFATGDGRVAEQSTSIDEAKEFLIDILRDGQMESKAIDKQAASAGIKPTTLWRAKKALRVLSSHEGYGPKVVWYWRLPPGA